MPEFQKAVEDIHKLKVGQVFFLLEDAEITDLQQTSSGTFRKKMTLGQYDECIIFKHNKRTTGIMVSIHDMFVPVPRKKKGEPFDFKVLHASPAFKYITISKDHVLAGKAYDPGLGGTLGMYPLWSLTQQKDPKKSDCQLFNVKRKKCRGGGRS
jgi:hypothetical protein